MQYLFNLRKPGPPYLRAVALPYGLEAEPEAGLQVLRAGSWTGILYSCCNMLTDNIKSRQFAGFERIVDDRFDGRIYPAFDSLNIRLASA
jgi:hypothetical protein